MWNSPTEQVPEIDPVDSEARCGADDQLVDGNMRRQLVQRCRQGDPDAQRMLYEQFSHRVYRTVHRIVGATDADDVTQDAFWRIYQSLDKFREDAQLGTWIYRVVVNECLQHLRRRRPATAQLPGIAADDDTIRSEHSELLEVALSRLDADLTTVFVLREMEQLSYADIAQTCGLSEGTVASRLNRARRRLREVLIELGWVP